MTRDYELIATTTTIVGLLITVIGFAVKITSIKDKANFRIENLEDKCKVAIEELNIMRDKVNNNDIIIMEIRTTLKNIEATLLELKARK